MKVLVIDIGGSRVKLAATGVRDARHFDSGPALTPDEFVARVRDATADWSYDAISLGYPGRVNEHGPSAEPGNLGDGWVGYDFAGVFRRPIRIVNDAVLQALGAYDGGRMLFLGLGTGLGSVLITERVLIPLELGTLLARENEELGDLLGHRGLARLGAQDWRDAVLREILRLRSAFAADYISLGGGNARLVNPLPEGVRTGSNDDAFVGGFRLWEEVVEPHDQEPRGVWRILR